MRVYFRFVRSAVHIGLAKKKKTPQVNNNNREKKTQQDLRLFSVYELK